MVVLALVLLILVAVFCVAIVLSNPDVYELSLFRVLVPVTSAGVFFTGFGAALVTIVALLLLRTGIRRSREHRERLRNAELAAINTAALANPHESADSGPSGERSAAVGPASDEPESTGSTEASETADSLDVDRDSSPTSADRRPTDPDRDEPRI